ncbi:type II toxin-antitoxin system VapC family toxin [Desulfobacterales bacterium HSG16]|nr:type II toxin-antitoxin system VapC family toxin [Desulfobacterales bacterium HSG16]
MTYLLDTNHCIYLINGLEKTPEKRSCEESHVIQAVRSLDDDEILYMSEVTLAELYYGAALSKRESQNIQKIEILTKFANLLSLTIEDWKIFGRIKALLRKKGKKMSDFDLLIACLGQRNHCTVVTNDEGFDNLPGHFMWVNWAVTGHDN